MRDKPNRLRQFAAATGRVWRKFLRPAAAEARNEKRPPRRHVAVFAHRYRRRPSFRYMI